MDFTGPGQTRPEAPTGGQLSLCVSPLFFFFFFPFLPFHFFFPDFFEASQVRASVAWFSEPLIEGSLVPGKVPFPTSPPPTHTHISA
jgi:hypothetical protein